MWFTRFVLFLLTVASSAVLEVSTDYPAPPQTFLAKDFTKWSDKDVSGSRKAEIDVEFTAADGTADFIKYVRLDLIGTPYQRGFAHGSLISYQIAEFIGPAMDRYFASAVLNIDISQFPSQYQKALTILKDLGKVAAPRLFHKALEFVWEIEKPFTPQYLIDEMNGIADGMCSIFGDGCDPQEWAQKLYAFNMFPELVRMACTAYGAWGDATVNNGNGGGLIQLRALDFGGGPFAKNTVLSVHRGDPSNPDHAFATVSFPGFVGVITGVSQTGIGISQKVWEVTDMDGLQPGTFQGEADCFVLREILEKSQTREEAEAFIQAAKRNWAIWVGIGDYSSGKFDLLGYKEESAVVYNDVTMPSMTGQPYFPSVVYVDKHTQPSWDTPNGTLPTALNDFYGKIGLETTKQIVQFHQTGDLHLAAYDYHNKIMSVSVGRTNDDLQYGSNDEWCAFNRPWVQYSLNDLWQGH